MLGDCMLRRCALRGFGVVDCVDVERVLVWARSVEVRAIGLVRVKVGVTAMAEYFGSSSQWRHGLFLTSLVVSTIRLTVTDDSDTDLCTS
jgi:hypothetical protein